MKKSEAYKLAQIAVVSTATIAPESKVDILRVLIADENLALFCEREKNNEEESGDAETV